MMTIVKPRSEGVPFLDLRAQYRSIGEEVRGAVNEVLDSQAFILGPTVQRFEEEAAAYLQCRAAVGVASGTDALLLSLMALGVGPGDGVVVPTFTFFSSVACATRLGATPVFADIDPESCLLDEGEVEAVLASHSRSHRRRKKKLDRIKVILPVHLFGRSCPMEPLLSLARRYEARIVEDVAQAMGSRVDFGGGVSKAAGTAGDLGCFSFFPTKMLGGIGDGGLVTTDDEALAERIKMLRVHGQGSKYRHEAIGINSRLDVLQAAVLRVKLRYLDRWCKARIQRADLYHHLFAETRLAKNRNIMPPPMGAGRSHVFNYYVIRAKRRDALKAHLESHGIQTQVYYPLPLHLQPCFADLGYRKGDFPNAELLATRALAIPMYPEIRPEQQETVVRRIADFYGK